MTTTEIILSMRFLKGETLLRKDLLRDIDDMMTDDTQRSADLKRVTGV